MVEVKEILRLWLDGRSLRDVTRLAAADRKTVRRYIEAAQAAGVDRDDGPGQLGDELLSTVIAAVRPDRPRGYGTSWETIAAHREQINTWIEQGLTLTKAHVLLERRGVVVPYRTLHRFAVTELGFGRRRATVPIADGDPGVELQVDFGRLGLVPDPVRGTRRVTHGLIFTAVYSRHVFVFPTHRQTLEAVIAGFDAAWAFFGGVFAVVIPDNLKPVVDRADPLEPRFNDAFREYAQARGFVIDPARVRHPQDKPRVERTVQYVRGNFFAGEDFVDLADCRARAEAWCAHVAGMRIHGSTRTRPAEVFAAQEAPLLAPAPQAPFMIPVFSTPKVARDRHVEVSRALYSVPGELIGTRITARADAATVKLYHRGQLLKVHPRQEPGGRWTDPADLPDEVSAYALRDLDGLARRAAGYGEHVGAYATAILEHPLPWTKMRQVYRLLGLARRHGAAETDTACARALEVEVINVGLIERMLTRGLAGIDTMARAEPAPPDDQITSTDATTDAAVVAAAGRFVRDPGEFSTRRPS
ncbi:IS21 family transposase [Actinomycetospora lutea]|uniref:IS21 family transposase n=1 Tax=Actinomycetospora lutea TaxID=663604 RepID=UPI002365E22C|nr:IS21 family transposase [Actinomycetospora lutea]MDD7939828.1 IS21 family transposase [Actinomycetospora lutea]